MTRKLALASLLITGFTVTVSRSFSPIVRLERRSIRTSHVPKTTSCPLASAPDHVAENVDTSEVVKDEEQSTLTLSGKVLKSTPPLPYSSPEQLLNFLNVPEHQTLLVNAGGLRKSEDIELSEELLQVWIENAEALGGTRPEKGDAVVSVETGDISFPGLSIKSLAQLGRKLVMNSEGVPELEFIMLGDRRTITGLPPVVWIYNQLTGEGKDNNKRTTTSTISRFGYEYTEEKKVVFTCDASLTVRVKFPSFLLKIMTQSKEKAEESGGKAIAKAVEKDVVKSLAAFQKAYENWIN